jgi:broad specificity phosphatase PhoE
VEILLIRHGDPDYARDDLTPRGVVEAKDLAAKLRTVHIDALYTSPLGRARATCAFTAEEKDLVPRELEWLRERAIKRGPVYLWDAPGEMFLQAELLPTVHDWYLPDGAMPEGREQFARVRAGLDDLLRSHGYARQGHGYRIEGHSGKRIALFCHKGVILTLLADVLHWALPMVFVSLDIYPTGVTRLEMVERDGFANLRALAINDLSHLGATSCVPPALDSGDVT